MKDTETHPIGTLMLIDDSEIDQMIYRRIAIKSGLVRDLLQFMDAVKAFEYLSDLENKRPDLILLDINMPGMDGFEFLEAATKQLGAELCPIVVMLTTSLNPKDEERAMSFSVVREFLSKPLTLTQLQALGALVGAKGSNTVGQ